MTKKLPKEERAKRFSALHDRYADKCVSIARPLLDHMPPLLLSGSASPPPTPNPPPLPRMLSIFHTLGGFYIKIGQNGASREDFVPEQVRRERVSERERA